MGSKPLPWPTYPVVHPLYPVAHPLTQLPCGCTAHNCRVIDGIGREIPEVVEFNVITKVATCNTKTDDGRHIFIRDADGSPSLARHTTHGARLFCAHGEVRAVDDADDGVCPVHDKHTSECGAFPCGNCGGDGLRPYRDADGAWRSGRCGRCRGLCVEHHGDEP